MKPTAKTIHWSDLADDEIKESERILRSQYVCDRCHNEAYFDYADNGHYVQNTILCTKCSGEDGQGYQMRMIGRFTVTDYAEDPVKAAIDKAIKQING